MAASLELVPVHIEQIQRKTVNLIFHLALCDANFKNSGSVIEFLSKNGVPYFFLFMPSKVG